MIPVSRSLTGRMLLSMPLKNRIRRLRSPNPMIRISGILLLKNSSQKIVTKNTMTRKARIGKDTLTVKKLPAILTFLKQMMIFRTSLMEKKMNVAALKMSIL